MAASSAEQILARAAVALAAGLPSTARVERFRGDAYSIGETPCVVLRRIGTRNEIAAFENAQATTEFDLGASSAPERAPKPPPTPCIWPPMPC